MLRRSATPTELPSLLSLLVRPPGVPGNEAGGVNLPAGRGVCEDDGVGREEEARGEVVGPNSDSTRSLTSFREVIIGFRLSADFDILTTPNHPFPCSE